MSVSKRLRYEILRRDAHTCRYCGRAAPDVKLTVDHVTPISLGGTDEATNLVAACADCNSGKTSSSPDATIVAGVTDDALRWASAMRAAAALQQSQYANNDRHTRVFLNAWDRWVFGDQMAPLPNDWPESVLRFYSLGLSDEDIVRQIDSILAANNINLDVRFRAFCGRCWRIVRERQDIALDLIHEENARG